MARGTIIQELRAQIVEFDDGDVWLTTDNGDLVYSWKRTEVPGLIHRWLEKGGGVP